MPFDTIMIGNLEFLCESFSDHFYKKSGILLCSHVVTNVVFSAGHVLTVVFGMGTGVTHDRIDTGQINFFMNLKLWLSASFRLDDNPASQDGD